MVTLAWAATRSYKDCGCRCSGSLCRPKPPLHGSGKTLRFLPTKEGLTRLPR
uniref:Uncharacterized protein n=1 Tax=Anguilla anguilla TaxID=7936 RepID=A0A0E9VD20_ANGAN